MLCRGFITLSAVLGQMAVATQAGLIRAFQHEPSQQVQNAILRAFGVFAQAAPYARLPDQLLPQLIEVEHLTRLLTAL